MNNEMKSSKDVSSDYEPPMFLSGSYDYISNVNTKHTKKKKVNEIEKGKRNQINQYNYKDDENHRYESEQNNIDTIITTGDNEKYQNDYQNHLIEVTEKGNLNNEYVVDIKEDGSNMKENIMDNKRNIQKYIIDRKEIKKMNKIKHREYISYNNIDQLKYIKFICQANSYDLDRLSQFFKSKNIIHYFYDQKNVICLYINPEYVNTNFNTSEDIYKLDIFRKNIKSSLKYKYIIFIFKNGSIVIWENFSIKKNFFFINKFMIFINFFSNELLAPHLVQFDTLYYSNKNVHKKEKTILNNGVIYLNSNSIELKLTISFALSQSIRLDVHELNMDLAIKTLFIFSKIIAKYGKCNITHKKISNMFSIYSSIINVNAVQDFLDIPEYFWNKVKYEHIWLETYQYLEIPERVKILNKRFFYYKDFYML